MSLYTCQNPPPRVNPNVNYDLWLKMMCRLINNKKNVLLGQRVDSEGVCTGVGTGEYTGALRTSCSILL